jgi:hypothetical protein
MKPKKEFSKIKKAISQAGELRDGLLIIFASTYIFGYMIWSWNAWKNNLGLLPVVNYQYISAGMIPVLIIITGYILLVFKNYISKHINRVYKSTYKSTNINEFIRLMEKLGFKPKMNITNLKILFYIIYFILLYSIMVYPNLPQEFGGPSPRWAYLDIDRCYLSNDTITDLFSESNVTSNSVIRSDLLDVYFVNSQYILVRPHKKKYDSEFKVYSRSTVYEIRESSIKGIIWCSQNKQEYLNVGNEFLKNHEYNESIVFYEKALDIDPKFAKAWYGLGIALNNTSRYEEANYSFRMYNEFSDAIKFSLLGNNMTEIYIT